MFEEQGQHIKQECANISKLIDNIWYHRLTHEQIMCYVKELHNQREHYQQQYTSVVAPNKSLQGELIKRREYLLQAQNEVLQLIIGTQEKRHAKYIFSVLNKILERED